MRRLFRALTRQGLAPSLGGILAVSLTFPAAAQPTAKPTVPSQPLPTGDRFLFVVETSDATRKLDPAIRQAVFDLIYTGFFGQMRAGDSYGIWTYNAQPYAGRFPMQVWEPTNRLELASRAAYFIKAQAYEERGDLKPVVALLQRLIRNVRDVNIFIVSDGTTPLEGTIMDDAVNHAYRNRRREQRKAKQPFITTLLARDGRIVGANVTLPDEPIHIPRVTPKLAKAQSPSEPPAPSAQQPGKAESVKGPSEVTPTSPASQDAPRTETAETAPPEKASPPTARKSSVQALVVKGDSRGRIQVQQWSADKPPVITVERAKSVSTAEADTAELEPEPVPVASAISAGSEPKTDTSQFTETAPPGPGASDASATEPAANPPHDTVGQPASRELPAKWVPHQAQPTAIQQPPSEITRSRADHPSGSSTPPGGTRAFPSAASSSGQQAPNVASDPAGAEVVAENQATAGSGVLTVHAREASSGSVGPSARRVESDVRASSRTGRPSTGMFSWATLVWGGVGLLLMGVGLGALLVWRLRSPRTPSFISQSLDRR